MTTVTQNSRRKEATSFVEDVAILDDVIDRLRSVENTLNRRIAKLRGKGDREVLFFELDLSIEEYRWLVTEVGAYVGAGRNHDYLFRTFPRVVIGAAVCAAMQSSREGAVWPTFWELVGVDEDDRFEAMVRKQVIAKLQKVGLRTFEGMDLGANRYVSLFLLHAGMTASQIVDITTFARERNWHGSVEDAEAHVPVLTAAIRNKELDRESLREFLEAEEDIAQAMYARTLELIAYFNTTPFDATSFQDTHGLPSIAFKTLVELVEQGSVTKSVARHESPYVAFRPESQTFAVVLPAPRAEWQESDRSWSVTLDDATGNSTTQTYEIPRGTYSPEFITIERPFKRIAVELLGGEEETFEFVGVTDTYPFIMVNRANRVQDLSGGLSPTRYTAVLPAGASLSTVGSQFLDTGSRIALGDWSGWKSCDFDLAGCPGLRVELPDATTVTLNTRAGKKFAWDREVATLDYARTVEHQPVFVESPRVHFSGAPDDVWRIDISYHPLDGEAEPVMTFEHVQAGSMDTVELFPDEFDDPWVGRYKVSLFRNGVPVDSMFFALAEGLELHASAARSNVRFRHQDLKGEFSHWSYSLHRVGSKKLEFNSQVVTLGKEEATRWESVSSLADYELRFEIVPETLVVRVKEEGAEPVEYLQAPKINLRQLDENGTLTVRVPEAVSCPRLVLVTKRREMLPLEQADHGIRQVRTVTVSNRALRKAAGKLSGASLHLTWSTLTFQDFCEQKSKNKTFNKLPFPDKVRDYLKADKSFAAARIAVLENQPLVRSIALDKQQLRVEQRARKDKPLLAWAWPGGNPRAEATRLERVKDSTSLFEVPADLVGAGPLIVDFREEVFLGSTAAPRTPTERAFYVEQDGLPDTGISVDLVPLALFGELDRFPLQPAPAARMWENYFALRRLHNREEFAPIVQRIKAVLHQSPRLAFEAWAATTLSSAERWEALILSGLHLRSLAVEKTHGAPHDDEFVSVLEEMTDAAVLEGRGDSEKEKMSSLRWVAAAGSPALWTALTTGRDEVSGDKGHRQAEQRCAQLGEEFAALGSLPYLSAQCKELAAAFGLMNADRSVLDTVAELGARARENSDGNVGAMVPYVSYVAMVVARGVANRSLPPWFQEELVRLQPELSRVAALAPELFAHDLLIGEALSQSVHFQK